MPRLCSTPVRTLNIIPALPTTLRGKLKQLICRWFDHAWEKVGSRATSWASAVELRRCSRCGMQVMEESVYY